MRTGPYTHRLTKTPTIPPGAHFGSALTPTSWELRDYLGDRLPLRIARLEAVGEGRNVTLFDGLRKWAYRARLGYSDWHLWERACRSHADALNAFASPLTTRERIRWPERCQVDVDQHHANCFFKNTGRKRKPERSE
jgi:hypothetical protein